MDRRRADLVLGALAALGVHGLVLAAAAGVLREHASDPGVRSEPPLELVAIDRADWRAQLEEPRPARATQPLEARVVHAPGALPDWPRLEVTRELPRSPRLVVRAIDTPLEREPRAQPRALERLEPLPLVPREERSDDPGSEEPSREARAQPSGEPLAIEGTSALVLRRPELHYPSRPHRRGIEGVVRVGLEVDAAGDVTRAWLIQSSGNRELDRAALRNLRAWRFDAAALAKRGGKHRFRNDVRFEIR